MLRLVVLSLCLAAVIGANVERNVNERILGGQIVPEETKYPGKCSLRYLGNHQCGCSILSNMHILTSARCARVTLTRSLSVHVGSNHINAGGQQYDVNNKTDHFDFMYNDVFSPDICILELLTPITFSETVQPVTLPTQGQATPAGSTATIVGWGFSAEDGPLNPSLLETDTPIMDWQACADYYTSEGMLTDRQICTDPAGRAGVCNGDNGGPLWVNGVQHGVVSWTSGQCALTQGFPGVYTRVAQFRDWITSTIGV